MPAAETEWEYYYIDIEGQPANVALDLALADEAPLSDKPYLLWISIKLKEPDPYGFPLEEEDVILDQLEDALCEGLDFMDAVQAGRIKSDGLVDYYFYSPDKDQFEDTVLEVMEGFSSYAFATDSTKDPEWDEYFGNLYPDYYHFQSILNRRVVLELQAEGDNPDVPRLIDHTVSFKDEGGRSSFKHAVEAQGYKILQEGGQDKDSEFPFPLHIAREDNAIPDELDTRIWSLCELATKNNGQYEGWGCDAMTKP